MKDVMSLYEGIETVDSKGKKVVSHPNQHFIMAYNDKELTKLQIGELR
jgi:hypothetical protein